MRELLAFAPEDASVYHNLGTVYLRQGRHAEAAEMYRQSVQRREDYAPT